MEELSLDNILSEEDIQNLFQEEDTQENKESPEQKETKEPETTEVDPNSLFENKPESVGSEETKEKEDTVTPTEGNNNTSPDFYSSIASALVEDGIFQDLDKEALSKIKTAEDFAEVFREQQRLQMDERQRRVDEALSVGVEPTEVQKYENYLNLLGNITEDSLSAEDERGENLRKNLIYQDYINKGFSKERALREVERSLKAGTDIEDAKDALESNRDYFNGKYKALVQEAKDNEKKEQEKLRKDAEALRVSILEDDKAFGEIEINKTTRQRVYDSIMKPVYTDPETGEKLTAIQKYEMENRNEFLKKIGLFYVLTDGFRSLDGLVQGKVKKEVKKGLRQLEHTISNTSRNSDGSLRFASGVGDPDSKVSVWDLDV